MTVLRWRLVANTERTFGSARNYWATEGPYHKPVLFTSSEVRRAMARAVRNPEDVPSYWWSPLARLWVRLVLR